MVLFKGKGRSPRALRVRTPVQSRLYPWRPTPNPQVVASSHSFPPHLSGVPPDPVPPLRLQTRRGACLLFGRRSGRPSASRRAGRDGASGWLHGVGRQSRRRRIVARWGALLALGCRQMRGGGFLLLDNSGKKSRIVLSTGARGAPKFILNLGCTHCIPWDSFRVPRRHAPP